MIKWNKSFIDESDLVFARCDVKWCVAIFGHCVGRSTLVQEEKSDVLMVVVGSHVQGCHSILKKTKYCRSFFNCISINYSCINC